MVVSGDSGEKHQVVGDGRGGVGGGAVCSPWECWQCLQIVLVVTTEDNW